uniref:hypothetical protein n=1 Tax=Algoriphagus locisalis TaxID=305507 RepID=UPI00111385B3|nr:hypothetical protein [Algoriphagus locisalis]
MKRFSEVASLRAGMVSFFSFSYVSLLVIEIEDPGISIPRAKRFGKQSDSGTANLLLILNSHLEQSRSPSLQGEGGVR